MGSSAAQARKTAKATRRIGAHMSISGGLHRAIERAHAVGCTCVQIFTKNSNQWACKPLEDPDIEAWRAAMEQFAMQSPIAHTSYLINLASPAEDLWIKSIDALVVEWQRADALALEGLVMHPGAFTSSNEADGLRRVAEGVRRALDRVRPTRCRLLLENTAGQGSCLGHSFAQLGILVRDIDANAHLGVCLDTCHALAAGYAINTPAGFAAMKREIRGELPAGFIHALHLNDSKKPCGSRVDRHEHIGLGEIGEEGFRLVLGDPLFRNVPGYLETPKGTDAASGRDHDDMNLERLRRIAGP